MTLIEKITMIFKLPDEWEEAARFEEKYIKKYPGFIKKQDTSNIYFTYTQISEGRPKGNDDPLC